MEKPTGVRVKEYNNGWAVELKFGLLWKNLHSYVHHFPDKYYFDTENEARNTMFNVLKLLK